MTTATALTTLRAATDAEEERAPKPTFPARWNGEGYTCTAVLERTAVLRDGDGEKHLANQADVLVDPTSIEWAPKPAHGARRWMPDSRPRLAAPSATARALRCVTEGCGGAVYSTNETGQCARCRTICPRCKGPKSRRSSTCKACRHVPAHMHPKEPPCIV